MSNILEVQEFFVEGSDHAKTHVLLHIAEPSAPHEKERGYLFALAEITDGAIEQIEALQELIDRIEANYYARDERGEDIFERVLQTMNRQTSAVVDHPHSLVHCIVGVIRNNQISLAYHGTPTAVLLYHGLEHIEYTSIIEATEDHEETGHLFSEITEGSLNPGDSIYITTPHVEDYFTTDRVAKIADSRTTRQTIGHIEKVLTELESEYSFGGILFHLTDKTDAPRTGTLPTSAGPGSEASLNQLLASAKSTEATLSPPLLGNVKTELQKLWQKTPADEANRESFTTSSETTHRANRRRNEPDSLLNRCLVGLGHGLVFIMRSLMYALKAGALVIGRSLRTIFILVTNRNNERTSTVRLWRSGFYEKQNFFRGLPILSKIILGVTLTLALAFFASIGYLHIKTQRDAATAQYQNIIQAALDKRDAAEASLIYDQKDKALALIQEAEKMLGTLPQDNDQHKKQLADIMVTLNGIKEKVRNIKTIQPEFLADLTTTTPSAKTTQLGLIGNQVFAFGPDDDMLYLLNTATKVVTAKNHDTVKGLRIAVVPAENDKVVFLTSGNTAAEYDYKTQAITSKSISFPAATATIATLGIYNRKLYAVDTTNKQIYKHNPTQTGYDKGVAWLKSGADVLADARSITVDGDVYVSKDNGEIKKFFTGEPQAFTITGLDPVLTHPTVVWTNSTSKDLFILEPVTKRVVVIDKSSGAFKNQYTATVWQNPTGMAVDTDGRTVYVLDANKVYRFTP